MTLPGESDSETWGEYCRRMADKGFPTGWLCTDCKLLWWKRSDWDGAVEHATETGHVLVLGPAPMRLL